MRNARWVQVDKEGSTTCEALTRLANDHAVDLLVAGSFGRKGQKLCAAPAESEGRWLHAYGWLAARSRAGLQPPLPPQCSAP